MAFDRFLVAPFNTGLQTDLKPFLILDDAFTELQNAYIFRGRVRKRFGSLLMGSTQQSSRLRVQIGTTDGSGNLAYADSTIPSAVLNEGSLFSVGPVLFSVYQVPTMTGPGNALPTLSTDPLATGTIQLVSAAPNVYEFQIAGSDPALATLQVFWYPANPVMGIGQYESGQVNNHPTYAFDTQFAYLYTTSGWARSGEAFWQGGDTNFFWISNWQNIDGVPVLFVTNFNATVPTPATTDDPIWWTVDGSNWTAGIGFNAFYFLPGGGTVYTGPFIQTARIIAYFKDRLILLNTVENDNSTPANLGNTDMTGGASGTVASGSGMIGQFFLIDTSIFEVTAASGALTVIGTGAGTFDTTTGAYTFTGAPASSAIYYYSGTSAGVNSSHVNRCRYSINGSPFARNGWYEANEQDSGAGASNNNNIAAGAGYIDASTTEQIISAEFIKDRLIVYFERSTWELAFTGNQVLPFVWQKINTELGSQSTFSTVPFDKDILTVGNTGIHACNGANVVRIDTKIPDAVFDEFEAADGATVRTAGIRDYFNELVYWTFVETSETGSQSFPNQILVYNYRNQSWALFDDCFTAFGYFEQQTGLTWADSYPIQWQNFNARWQDDLIESNQRQIIAGTPEGFVVRIASGLSRNAPTMQITNITDNAVMPTNPWVNGNGQLLLTVINHNFSNDNEEGTLENADYVLIENVTGDAYTETVLNGSIFPVTFVDVNTILIDTNPPIYGHVLTSGTYTGGGTLTRVSNIQIETKQMNPYMKDDRNVFLHRIDFAVQRTQNGEMTVDYYPSSSEVSMVGGGASTASLMGTSVLETSPYDPAYYPLEQFQDRLWHPVYFQSDGNSIQLYMYMTYDQMINRNISLSDFEMEGWVIYAQATTSRMQ